MSYAVPALPKPGTPCRWFACSKAAVALMVDPADSTKTDALCQGHADRLAKSTMVIFHQPTDLELCRFTGPIPDAILVLKELTHQAEGF